MNRHAWLAIVLVLIAATFAGAKERTWTDSAGRTMRAEFVREIDGEVTFLKGGKIVTLPLDTLSERDQQIVRDLAAGKSVPDDPTPTPAAVTTAAPLTEPANSPFSPSAGSSEAAADESKPSAKKPAAIENRTWTDIHGNQVTGKYVRIFSSNVVLSRSGRSVTVRFYELTSEDQEYLRELLTARGQEGLIPPKVDDLDNQGPDDGNNTSAPAAASAEANPAPAPEFSNPMPRSPGPMPGNSPFPGPGAPAPAPLPTGPAFPMPGANPFGQPPGSDPYSPPAYPGSSTPAAAPVPYGMPPPSSSPGSSSFDRFEQQRQEREQRRRDSLEQLHNRMNERINRTRAVAECMNCNRSLTEAESSRDTCPQCGVRWDYEIDEYGNRKELNRSSSTNPFSPAAGGNATFDERTARKIGVVLAVFVGLALVIGMIIGVIYIAMSIASATSTNRPRQYY